MAPSLILCGLAACNPADLVSRGAPGPDGPLPAGEDVRMVERDVEAPEVFALEDRAVWDGRPSLGGIWVAAPGVEEPERVLIRSAETGEFVVGALFRRERAVTGPPIQLSSEAAAALGLPAGRAGAVSVVALRRTAVPEGTPDAKDAAVLPPVDGRAIDAALAAAEASGAAEPALPGGAAPAAALETPAEATASTAPADAPAATVPVRVVEVALAATAPGPVPDPLADDLPEAADAPAPAPVTDDAPEAVTDAAPATEAAPDTVSVPVLDLAASALLPARPPAAGPSQSAPAGTTDPARAPTPLGPPSGLDAPYVQVGYFGEEANALSTADAMRGAGIVPTVVEGAARGRPFWRVLVGPATTRRDRAAVIRTVRGLGYADAYAVPG